MAHAILRDGTHQWSNKQFIQNPYLIHSTNAHGRGMMAGMDQDYTGAPHKTHYRHKYQRKIRDGDFGETEAYYRLILEKKALYAKQDAFYETLESFLAAVLIIAVALLIL